MIDARRVQTLWVADDLRVCGWRGTLKLDAKKWLVRFFDPHI